MDLLKQIVWWNALLETRRCNIYFEFAAIGRYWYVPCSTTPDGWQCRGNERCTSVTVGAHARSHDFGPSLSLHFDADEAGMRIANAQLFFDR